MKPLFLTVQAFGPFAKKQTLNFTALGENPLFLINGPTGSGKSTLLDAMTFALYGQTSGKERDAAQMRCDNADISTPTEVTFTFLLADQVYRVNRLPMQERPKARGDGTTIQQTEASLWALGSIDNYFTHDQLIEGKILTSKNVSQVNERVKELIGLDADQFRQVMILPQGKFRDFLLADSNQREKIFSALFQTQIYIRLQEKLESNARAINDDYRRLKTQEQELLQEFNAKDYEAIAALVNQQQEYSTAAQERLDHQKHIRDAAYSALNTATSLNEQFCELEKYQQEYRMLSDQQDDIALQMQRLTAAKKAEGIAHHKANLDKLTAQIVTLDLAIEQRHKKIQQQQEIVRNGESAYSHANAILADLKATHQQIAYLQQLQPKVAELASAQVRLNEIRNAHTVEKNCAVAARTTLEKNKAALKSLTERINQHAKSQQQLAEKIPALDRLQLSIQRRQRWQELSVSLAQNSVQINLKQKQLEQLKQRGLDSKNHKTQLEYYWHSQQAALLAAQLKDDMPCPVCGSKAHPAPAAINGSHIVERADILVANEAYENLRTQYSDESNRLTELTTQRSFLIAEQNEIGQQSEGQLFDQHNEQLLHELQTEIGILKKAIYELRQALVELPELQKTCEQLQRTLDDNEIKCEQSSANLQKAEQELAVAQHFKGQLEQAVPEKWHNAPVLEAEIKRLTVELETAQEAVINCQRSLAEERLNLNSEEVGLKEREEHRIIVRKEIDQSQMLWSQLRAAQAFSSEQEFLQAYLSTDQQTKIAEKINLYDQKINTTKSHIEALQIKLANKIRSNINELTEHLEVQENNYDIAQIQWQQINIQLDKVKTAKAKLQQLASKIEKLEKDYELYGSLAQMASGKNPQKLSLQRFVLGVLLDDVLIEASHRLIKMSKGRYRLLRNLDRAKGNLASGLELLVEDSYTGKTRSAATLSGGESFLAALALALGLSDVVQAYAGGIQLDALFIDEGFGSLDQDALELAINTLIDLQTSGKMIGIISHVSELKEQMALRVDIHYLTEGSQIAVVV
jgi:exonuclease SbcC